MRHILQERVFLDVSNILLHKHQNICQTLLLKSYKVFDMSDLNAAKSFNFNLF